MVLGEREQRGLQIAALHPIKQTKVGYLVPSQSGKGSYVVTVDGEPFCTCPDFEERRLPCKHIYAVEFTIQRETRPDGTTVLTKTMRVTYGQNWPAYNAAQAHEQEHFPQLLRSLCEGVQQPPQQGRGRRSHLLSDVVFSLVSKVYSGMSARRFIGSLADDQEDGNLIKALSYNSMCDYLENPALTPLLKTLIEESASPLKAVEANFAVDSSGFSTCIYDRWFDAKYGKVRSEQQWITAHLMTGVTTNIVTSVEVTHQRSQDAPHFPGLVDTTARTFPINEVSADKAYSSKKNLQAVQAHGGVAYIPFKDRTTGLGHRFDPLWNKMWAYYQFNRQEFLAHYHKRSNVESTFSALKRKFGTAVRSKTPTAQINEVLCKVLAYNLCVLIGSMYELGLEPIFWAERADARQIGAA